MCLPPFLLSRLSLKTLLNKKKYRELLVKSAMATRTVASRKSRFDHLSFLQKVNECPFLYDINDANYKDMVLKEARWTEIGAGFSMTGQVAQLKWKSLRDRFTREKKKYEDLRKNNSEDEVPPPKWWLFVIIGKMLERAHDLPLLLMNGDGYEGNGAGNDSYEPSGSVNSFADDRSSFPNNNYRHNNNNNNSKNHHHLRNHRHSNNNNNHGETSRSSMCSADQNESDMANPAESVAGTSAVEISSAVHCEVSIEDDDDDSNAPNATSTNQFQHQHNNSQSCSNRKRARVEDTMAEWTYQLSNCLLQRIVDIYPPNPPHGINGGANQAGEHPPSMDEVDYYVRSLGPRLRKLKAKDRGLVRLKIETALYDIESAVDE